MAMLHWVDGAWSAVRYRPGATGIEVLDAARLETDQVPAWCNPADTATRIVIPARSVICRSIGLGRGDEADVDHRLHEIAAERLGDSAPLHRQAVALLPATGPEDERVGVAVAWPSAREVPIPPLDETSTLAVPDVAGLLSAAASGHPDVPLLWHDAADGSTALVLSGRGKLALRSTHAGAFDSPEAATRFVLESAMQAGWSADEATRLSAPATASPDHALSPEAATLILRRVTGSLPEDPTPFLMALACGLATSDDFASLTVLRPRLPKHEPTFTERWIDRLSNPRMALRLAAAFVIVLLLGPLVLNGVRYALLSMAHSGLTQAVQSASAVEQRNRLYAQLGTGSLPVTKLLADIAAATPLGVKIESIKMGAGEPIRIAGDATTYQGTPAADLIGNMKANMQSSRVFKDVTVEWGGQSNLGERSFSLNADIGAPAVRPTYPPEQDFAAWTHQQRRYSLPTTAEGGPDPRPSVAATWLPGEADASTGGPAPASARPAPAGPSTPASPGGGTLAQGPASPSGAGSPAATKPHTPPSTTPPSVIPRRTDTRPGGSRPGGGGDMSASDTASRSVAGTSARSGDLSAEDLGAMPEILTDAQIATLNRAETLAKVNEVTKVKARFNDPTLDDYWRRLFEHLRKLGREGGS
ncbi:MAG: hypothetical protein QF733_02875 [Phycisphaerales bacterium]|jgi:hypothetical protein|nr:hypothetical protein [Phycisphaerales bacterium]